MITGNLTRKQIVDRALRKAGNTALASSPDYDAQTWLGQILFDLYMGYRWPWLEAATTITLNDTTTALSVSFGKPIGDDSFTVQTINGVSSPQVIRFADSEAFQRLLDLNPTTTGVPQVWTLVYSTTNSSPSVQVWPNPIGAGVTAQLRFQSMPAEIPVDTTGDSTIPTFPWHDYLIQALYVAALEYEFDSRSTTESQKRELMLDRVCKATFPLRSQTNEIPLDRSVFGTPYRPDVGSDVGWNWLR